MDKSRFGKTAGQVARLLLGLVFFVFGLNGFLQFLPQPPLPPKALPFITGLASSGYLFPLLKGVEIIAAVLLLTNRSVPLALVMLAPIVVNIAAFHFVLAPGGAGIAVVVLALELFLAWKYRAAFAPLFTRSQISSVSSTRGAHLPAPQPSR